MESIIRLNHRNRTQLQDIVNQINTIIGARVISTYNSDTSFNSDFTETKESPKLCPICGSSNVYPNHTDNDYRCVKCGQEFEGKAS